MKKYAVAIFLMFWGYICPSALAAVPPVLAVPSGLSLAEIKITGNEFLVLQNNGPAITDLSRYWLYTFNNTNPMAAGVSSSSQQLPAGSLASGQTVLLSAAGGNTCGATVSGKLSVSLTDSGGFLEIVQTSLSGGVLVQTAGDAVSWSSGANSAVGMIANVPSNTSAPNAAYYRYQNTATGAPYLWQLADIDTANACQLNVTLSGISTAGPNGLSVGTPPPATIISASDGSQSSGISYLPAGDIGLAAPQINELLPNPADPQTDSEDEFIELYNSNDAPFDLTDFKLQTGTTSLHTYTFPAGSSLPAKSFTAFYSIDTGLSLSNTSSQARLLDPGGNSISQSDSYGSAPDGQSWALADGTWYWSTTVTPGAANIVSQPLSVQSLSVGTTSKTAATTAKKTTTTAKTKAASTANSSSPSSPAAKNASPLHPLVLAVVGTGAVAYAAYEYRNDMANRLYQLRRYRAARAAAGPTTVSASAGGTAGRFGRWQDYLRSRLGPRPGR